MEDKIYTKTWVWRIKKLMHELKLNDLWDEQYNIERNLILSLSNIRLAEYSREQWINSAKLSHKGRNYLEIAKFKPSLKSYLNFLVNDRSVGYILKIRTGNNTLSVEVDRYKNRKTYEECICKSCNEQEIEDLYHVIVKCKGYLEFS